MRILLVEDDAAKAAKIESLIARELGEKNVDLTRSGTINDGLTLIGEGRFDVVVVDLVLPQMRGGEPVDATSQWCELIEHHLSGRTASWIVMTGFPDVVEGARRSFGRHNVAVISYDDSGFWERHLRSKIRDSYEARALDFIIVCALEKERRAYEYTTCELGQREVVAGLDCQYATIGGLRGAIVVQPSPGLISAAIVTTKAAATFRPRAIAMSGICGGRDNESEVGALVVPDLSWNYQRGKFKGGKLVADLHQVSIPPSVRATLLQVMADLSGGGLRKGLMFSELSSAGVLMAPMVSGSQVVADKLVGMLIGEQGRKVAAVDMEVASVFFAAHEFYDGSGVFFAAKAVVDMADPMKGDQYHEYGSAISARFVVDALSRILEA